MTAQRRGSLPAMRLTERFRSKTATSCRKLVAWGAAGPRRIALEGRLSDSSDNVRQQRLPRKRHNRRMKTARFVV